ncbi:hypothetical protein QCA50_002501 [Cerrena zonata]|uniref:Uncharacterized protein n=1 Tax=Cerrena zonata TaxID=2478898 RepID=A0AAW0GZ93_9APHY
MFVAKPKRVALTFLCTIAVVLALTSAAEANPQHRDHVVLHRMIKKRADNPLASLFGGDNAGSVGAANDPPTDSSSSVASVATSSSVAASSSVTPSASASSTASLPASSASSASSSSVSSVSSSASSSSASSSVASSTSSSVASSSAESSATPSATPTATEASVTQAPTDTAAQGQASDSSKSAVRVTQTVTSDAPAETSAQAAQVAGATSKGTKTTLIVLFAIAGSIGAIVVAWTIFRKIKFKPSAEFEERMQPIDWQPTTGPADDGVPGLHRNSSARSHGSFGSGGHDDNNFAGRGVGGGAYGSDHGHGITGLQPIPDHDFTAGPSLAPVGGYADLARGPSPGPQMGQLQRGPSVGRGYDPYAAPQAAYDYNGTAARY